MPYPAAGKVLAEVSVDEEDGVADGNKNLGN